MRSAKALPSALNTRYTRLRPGLVIFSTVSEILMRGSNSPRSLVTAHSLYTAPNTGSDLAVIMRSPTPKESILPPWSSMEVMVYSSRLLETTIFASA